MAKKKKLKKRKISKKHELQSVEVKNVVILLVILIAIMSACTFVFYQINQEIILNKIEKDSENKVIARNLIHKNTGYKVEDVRYVQKTENDDYLFVIRSTEGTKKEKYYEVDVNTKEYNYIEVLDVQEDLNNSIKEEKNNN